MASCGFMDHLNRVTIGEDESKIQELFVWKRNYALSWYHYAI